MDYPFPLIWTEHEMLSERPMIEHNPPRTLSGLGPHKH
jgi:hypothetical protein